MSTRVDLEALRRGDRQAFTRLVDRSLDRMHDVAAAIVGDTTAAIEVCADVLGALHHRRIELTEHDVSPDRLLLATRQRSLSYRRLQGYTTHRPPRNGTDSAATTAPDDPEATARFAAAGAASVVLGAAITSALDLHYRHGVDAAAFAADIGAAAERAQRRLDGLRSELDDVLGAYALWNDGAPTCGDLATELDGGEGFSPTICETVDRHRATCVRCSQVRHANTGPSSVMLSAEIVVVSATSRHGVMAAIENQRSDPLVDNELESEPQGATGQSNIDPPPEPDDNTLHSLWGEHGARSKGAAADTTTVVDEATIDDLWASTTVAATSASKARPNGEASANGVDNDAESTATPATMPARRAGQADSAAMTDDKTDDTADTDQPGEHHKRPLAIAGGAAAAALVVGLVVAALWPGGGSSEVSEPAATTSTTTDTASSASASADSAGSDSASSDSETEVRSLGIPPPAPTTDPPTDPTTTTPETTRPVNTSPATTAPVESAPVPLLQLGDIPVAAANGSGVAGAAARNADRLEAAGFANVLPLDGTAVIEFSVVYYADGFEGAARQLALELDLLPGFVAPIDEMPAVEDLPNTTALIAYIGRDRA